MISLSEINLASEKFHVSAETIEKDYMISWILLCLSKSRIFKDFTFYGGTAIKRIYFEDHRFSEDVDLISTGVFTQDYLLEELGSLRYARDNANIILEVDQNNITRSKGRAQMFIRYSGYDEIVGSPKEVRIDFCMDMDLYGDIVDEKIIKSYSDITVQKERLSVMTLNTILANKLGLLMDSTRNEPRDLFDIWFLLKRASEFNFNFEKISSIFKKKYSFSLSPTILKSYLKNHSLKQRWEMRLSKQIAELPKIETVINEIEMMIRKLFTA